MSRLFVTFDRFDTVVVPFPFTDRQATKKRPALILSTAAFTAETGNMILAMITSSQQSAWPGDTELENLGEAGLQKPCKVRMKLFTLDRHLIIGRIGYLSDLDQLAVKAALSQTVGS
jgi:mRNA interferase MazF